MLIASNKEEKQKMVVELVRESKKVGHKVNTEKTKYMQNAGRKEKNGITIEGEEIEKVDEYTYPGSLVSFPNKMEKEIGERKRKAWKGFWALKQLHLGDFEISLYRSDTYLYRWR